MPQIQKVSVALTGEPLSALKSAVAAGEYATTSDIVREAIRVWHSSARFDKKKQKDFALPGTQVRPAARLVP